MAGYQCLMPTASTVNNSRKLNIISYISYLISFISYLLSLISALSSLLSTLYSLLFTLSSLSSFFPSILFV